MPVTIPYESGFGLAGWDWQAQRQADLQERNRKTAQFPLEQERRRFDLNRDKELLDAGRPGRTFTSLMDQYKVNNIEEYKKAAGTELMAAVMKLQDQIGDSKQYQAIQKMAGIIQELNVENPKNQNLAMNPQRLQEIEKLAKENGVDISSFGTPGSQQWTDSVKKLTGEFKSMILGIAMSSGGGKGILAEKQLQDTTEANRSLENTKSNLRMIEGVHDASMKEEAAEQNFEYEKQLIKLRGQIQKEVANLQKDGRANLRERLAEAQLKGDRDTARAIATALFIGETGDASLQFNDQGKIIGFQPTDKLKDVLKTIDIMMGASPSSEAPKDKTSQGPEPSEKDMLKRQTISQGAKIPLDQIVVINNKAYVSPKFQAQYEAYLKESPVDMVGDYPSEDKTSFKNLQEPVAASTGLRRWAENPVGAAADLFR